MNHDEILERHRSKFDSHRQWMEQNLRELSSSNTTPRSARPVPQSTNFPNAARELPQVQDGAVPVVTGTSWGNHSPPHVPPPAAQSPIRSNAASVASFYTPGSPLHVYSRASQWQRRRQQKLAEKQHEHLQEELSECTFQPEIYTHMAVDGGLSSTANTEVVFGWRDFVLRQEKGRARRQEIKDKERGACHRWTGERTVPVEFHLGRRQAVDPISALHPPVALKTGTRYSVSIQLLLRYHSKRYSDDSDIEPTENNDIVSENEKSVGVFKLPPQGSFSDYYSLAPAN